LAPAIAGIFIVPIAIEFGTKTGWMMYAAIGLLSFVMVPDKEMSLIFLFFLGFYPLAKAYIQRLPGRVLPWAVKLALFNVCVISMYALILYLFPIDAVVAEFQQESTIFIGLLLAMGNVTFVIYDIAVARIVGLYCAKLRRRLFNLH
jgi:hypothetical protein